MKLWLIKTAGGLEGPLPTIQVEDALKSRRFQWLDFALAEGTQEWRPLVAINEFQHLIDAAGEGRGSVVRSKAGVLSGPFDDGSIKQRIKAGMISYDDSVESSRGWQRIGDDPRFAQISGQGAGCDEKSDKREPLAEVSRAELLASVLLQRPKARATDERPAEACGEDLVGAPSWFNFI